LFWIPIYVFVSFKISKSNVCVVCVFFVSITREMFNHKLLNSSSLTIGRYEKKGERPIYTFLNLFCTTFYTFLQNYSPGKLSFVRFSTFICYFSFSFCFSNFNGFFLLLGIITENLNWSDKSRIKVKYFAFKLKNNNKS